jgi:hypothetical protein
MWLQAPKLTATLCYQYMATKIPQTRKGFKFTVTVGLVDRLVVALLATPSSPKSPKRVSNDHPTISAHVAEMQDLQCHTCNFGIAAWHEIAETTSSR